MDHDPAEVCRPAGARGAGVDTLVLLAGCGQGAILIHYTLPSMAGLVWVAHGAGGTFTGAAVPLVNRQSPGSTGVGYTGVWPLHTPQVATDVSILTVWVHDTLWSTARDGVWLGDKAGQAAADWVPVNIGCTSGGARVDYSTRGGVAGVPGWLPALYEWMGLWPVSLQSSPALAHGPAFLGDAHGCAVTGAGVARVAGRFWLVFWLRRWWWGGVSQACVGTAVKAAETPVRAV